MNPVRLSTDAQSFELPECVLLRMGGALYNNNDAEPELYDLVSGMPRFLPGREKEGLAQAKKLDAHRAKEKR